MRADSSSALPGLQVTAYSPSTAKRTASTASISAPLTKKTMIRRHVLTLVVTAIARLGATYKLQ